MLDGISLAGFVAFDSKKFLAAMIDGSPVMIGWQLFKGSYAVGSISTSAGVDFTSAISLGSADGVPERYRMKSREAMTVSLHGLGTIVESSPIPLYFQLIHLLEQKIRAGDWRPGASLPSEQALCDHFGLSRTVVRQAFADLGNKGLLKKQNGKRTMVAYPAYRGTLMQNLVGFHEEAELRKETPKTRVMEFKKIPADKVVSEKLGVAVGNPVILLTRLRYLGAQPQVFVKTYLNYSLCAPILGEDLSSQSLYRLLQEELGLMIVKGVRTIRAIAVNSRESKLLEVPRNSPALLLESIGFIADGTPLEFFVAKHRGDRTAFDVQLVR